jgi:hypothetical protein
MNTTYGNSQNAPAWSGKLKDQPAGERPRERLIERGAAALSAAELIAILVKTGLPGTNALDIGKQLIQKFGSLGAMAKASVDELQCIRGIGRDKAVTLVAAFTLASKIAEELQRESPVLDNPQAIVELAAAGIIGERSKKPLVLGSIVQILRNPFYYGVFAHKGEIHQGVHVPMISKTTFDEIQQALVKVGKTRHKRAEDKGLAFLDFATCGSCGYRITGERHKKNGRLFRYYRCTHKNKKYQCDARVFVPHEKFTEEVKRNAQLIVIPDEWKEKFLAKIETWESESSLEKQQKIDALKSDLISLKAKIDRINNAFTEGALEVQEFKELKNPLVPLKADLEQQIVALERSKLNRLEPLRNWILEANMAEKAVSSDNWLKMKSFLKENGSNRLLRAQTLTVSFKKPFDLLAETTTAVRSTTDVSAQCSRWWRRRELNPRPKSTYQPRLHAYSG